MPRRTILDPALHPVALVSVSRTSRVPSSANLTPSTVPTLVTDPALAPGPDDRADAVAVVYHPGLTPQERVAVTGPRTGNSDGSSFWVGLAACVVANVALVGLVAARGLSEWWFIGGLLLSTVVALMGYARLTRRMHAQPWERWVGPTLEAHARLLGSTVPARVGSGGPDPTALAVERWADLVRVATLPRPLADPRPTRPDGTRGHQKERHWVTPTGPSGVPLSEARYADLVQRLVAAPNDLAATGGRPGDPRHEKLWDEVAALAVDQGETVPRSDWFPLVDPLPGS